MEGGEVSLKLDVQGQGDGRIFDVNGQGGGRDLGNWAIFMEIISVSSFITDI